VRFERYISISPVLMFTHTTDIIFPGVMFMVTYLAYGQKCSHKLHYDVCETNHCA